MTRYFPADFTYIESSKDLKDFLKQEEDKLLIVFYPKCSHCIELFADLCQKGSKFRSIGFLRVYEAEKEEVSKWLRENGIAALPTEFPHALFLNCPAHKSSSRFDTCKTLSIQEFTKIVFE